MQVRSGVSRAVFQGSRTPPTLRGRRGCKRLSRESRGALMFGVFVALFLLVGCGGQRAITEIDEESDVADGSTGGGSLSGGSASADHDGGAGGQTNDGGFGGNSNGGYVGTTGPWIDERDLVEVSEVAGTYHMVSQRGDYLLIDGDVDLSFGGTPGYFSWDLCNHHSGIYEIREGRLVPGSIERTQTGCGFEVDSWQGWLEKSFLAQPMIRSHGENLVLMSERTQLVFAPGRGPRAQLLPTAPFEKTVWTVTDVASNPDGMVYVWHYYVPNPDFLGSIVFVDGTVTVTGPCNVGTGRYSIVETTEKALFIEEMGWTKTACTEPDASLREQVLAQVFEGEPFQFRIYDQSLMISRTDYAPTGPIVSHYLRARADLD